MKHEEHEKVKQGRKVIYEEKNKRDIKNKEEKMVI